MKFWHSLIAASSFFLRADDLRTCAHCFMLCPSFKASEGTSMSNRDFSLNPHRSFTAATSSSNRAVSKKSSKLAASFSFRNGWRNIIYVFGPDFFKIAEPKLTIRASFLAMADISSFFIEERTLSWKLFFTSLVDNTVVGNRSLLLSRVQQEANLASCGTLDHFGGVSWDRWGQFCRCLHSSDAMKNPYD